ncbi:MAG: hypothetical protein ACPLKS_08130 [Caldisericum exile]|uniref:hypothetical protein n=1 Tax=Caldisericum exile TaxID=693075 RepID=UPI003C724072
MVNVEINPTNQTILLTEKLTLKATVTNGTGNITYQWSVNGENATNATEDTFLFDPQYVLGEFTVGVYVEDEEGNATAETTVNVVSGTTVKNAVEDVKTKLDDVLATLGDIETQLDNVNTAIEALNGKTDTANVKLDSVDATLKNINDAL